MDDRAGRGGSQKEFSAPWHFRTSNRARTTQRNTTSNHLRNKILSHTHLARTCLAHTGIACALLSFAFQMSAQSWYLDCKCVLFLVTLHMSAYCLHITDGCISRVHACIVFALRMSVFESPCGGSANACTYGICSADSCLAHWLDLDARCLQLITRTDITLSHALLLLSYMLCDHITTCTALTSSHVLLLIHHIYDYYFITCTAIT